MTWTLLLILVIVIVAAITYVFPAIPEMFKRILYAMVAILFIVWILALAGIVAAPRLP